MSDIVPIPVTDAHGDLLIGCIGYEKRSTFLLRTTPKRTSNVFFDYQALDDSGKGIYSYEDNLKIIDSNDVISDKDFENFLGNLESEIG